MIFALFSHKSKSMSVCTFVCLSISQSVTETPQQLEIIILHHPSFNNQHSSFFIHPSFITRLLSFSACYLFFTVENSPLTGSNSNRNGVSTKTVEVSIVSEGWVLVGVLTWLIFSKGGCTF